jgi:hypothetical protein
MGAVTAGSPIGFSGWWRLRDTLPGGPASKSVYFGQAGSIPVTGDWNGDGFDTLGYVVYNSATQHLDWYLTNTILYSVPDGASGFAYYIEATYGDSGDIPIVGNFDGAGGDSKGVVRRVGSDLRWYPQTAPVFGFAYGLPSDNPTRGDWNCDARDSPGVTRTNSAGSLQWHLDNWFGTGVDYAPFLFGAAYPWNLFDRGDSGRWYSPTPACSRPMISRNGATEWYGSSDLLGTLGLAQTWGAPVGSSDYGLVADWDLDSLDDYIALY